MTIEQKALLTIGLLQLLTEYTEELYDHPYFKSVFVRELKRDTKQFLKSSEKIVDRISNDVGLDLHEQIYDLYRISSQILEEGIIWKDTTKTKENEEAVNN